MTIDVQGITDALVSHAQSLGKFDLVQTFEPKSSPGTGLTCAIWMQSLRPHAQSSGLAATSAYLVMSVRIYDNMLREPADLIDPEMLAATETLIESYSGEFTLAGVVRNIDLLGEGGESLGAEAGYVQIGGREGGMYRVMTITVPMIISDAWTQVP
jgi:hypothetical protein